MPVYKKDDLLNLEIRSVASNACQQDLITEDEKEKIFRETPVGFYSPNIFLRTGIGLLTALAVNAILGLLLLVTDTNEPTAVFFFMSLICFCALEFVIMKWQHFQSGLDDVLLHLGIIYFLVFISMTFEVRSEIVQTILAGTAIIIYSLSALRYLDRLSAILAVFSLAFFVFSLFSLKEVKTSLFLFLSLAIGMAILYFMTGWLRKKTFLGSYFRVMQMAQLVAAIGLYASFHIYFITEIQISISNDKPIGNPAALTWFSWCWTVLLPFLYLIYGITKKDRYWMRIGLLLFLSAFYFIHYYHPMLSFEVSAILYGFTLVVVSYALIQYLRNNQKNFTYEAGGDESDLLLAEPMLVAAGFSGTLQTAPAGTSSPDTRLGGGDFGGGGAGGEF